MRPERSLSRVDAGVVPGFRLPCRESRVEFSVIPVWESSASMPPAQNNENMIVARELFCCIVSPPAVYAERAVCEFPSDRIEWIDSGSDPLEAFFGALFELFR